MKSRQIRRQRKSRKGGLFGMMNSRKTLGQNRRDCKAYWEPRGFSCAEQNLRTNYYWSNKNGRDRDLKGNFNETASPKKLDPGYKWPQYDM